MYAVLIIRWVPQTDNSQAYPLFIRYFPSSSYMVEYLHKNTYF